MASAPSQNSPTLAEPRISAAKFKQQLLTKHKINDQVIVEANEVYNILVAQGVDVSFALAQFRVESQYGTAGYAKVTGSWGNMLHDPNLTLLESGTYSPGNGYIYATYSNYIDAITDYCRYIHWYKSNYNLITIYQATARWIGKTPGSTGHSSYVQIIVSDMVKYEYPEGTFYDTGDKMIYGGDAFDRNTGKIIQKYPITLNMNLYRGTDGTLLKQYKGIPGNAWFLGLVQGSTTWGVVCIGTSTADPYATWCYIKNVDTKKIIKI